MSDTIARAAAGDMLAIYQLIYVDYAAYLRGVAHNLYPKAPDDEIDEVIADFYLFVVTPDSNGNHRLRNLSDAGSPRTYMGRMLNNHITDQFRDDARNPVLKSGLDEGRASDNYDEPAAKKPDAPEAAETLTPDIKEAQIGALFNALESIDILSPTDRYILLTFLIGLRFKGEGKPLKLQVALGRQLDMNASTTYNRYSDARKALEKVAKAQLARLLENNE